MTYAVPKICLFASAIAASLTAQPSAWGAIQAFNNNQAGFSADAGSMFTEIGIEGFEDNTVASETSQSVGPAFNSSPNPTSPNGRVVSSANSRGRATRGVGAVIGNNTAGNGLVIAFEKADQIKAVGFNPIAPVLNLMQTARFSVLVKLFDNSTLEFGTMTPVGPNDSLHFGVTTDLLDSPIAQITFSPAIAKGQNRNTLSGIDNLSVYSLASAAVPEPGMAMIGGFLTMVGSIFLGRRKA